MECSAPRRGVRDFPPRTHGSARPPLRLRGPSPRSATWCPAPGARSRPPAATAHRPASASSPYSGLLRSRRWRLLGRGLLRFGGGSARFGNPDRTRGRRLLVLAQRLPLLAFRRQPATTETGPLQSFADVGVLLHHLPDEFVAIV